jgi:excisionase family DNA binding protein
MGNRNTAMLAAARSQAPLRSIRQTAARLGISEKGVRGWIYRRAIPYVKVGRAVRISDETIDDIIERGTMPALDRE